LFNDILFDGGFTDGIINRIPVILGEQANAGQNGFDINLEHPQYVARKQTWKRYRDPLFWRRTFQEQRRRISDSATERAARRLRRAAGKSFLRKLCRLDRRLVRIDRVPERTDADVRRRERSGQTVLRRIVEDVDRRGTPLADFFRRQFADALVTGTSYALVDFPRLERKPENRAQEEALGASRAYLVEYGAESLINWSRDDSGNYEWVVLRRRRSRRSRRRCGLARGAAVGVLRQTVVSNLCAGDHGR